MSAKRFDWTDRRVLVLRQMRHLNMTATEIAYEFSMLYGGTVTRNMICGKLHRLANPDPPRKPKSKRPKRAAYAGAEVQA